MISFKMSSREIKDDIYIPKYYDADLKADIESLRQRYIAFNLGSLIDSGAIEVCTGHEIGKMSYGTGDIPFVRTSDISNWEVKTVPKQGVSTDVYTAYAKKQDVRPGDILMVKDGSYLIGVTCMLADIDLPMLFQSHILKFRVTEKAEFSPEVFFLALNTPIVQRQIRSFQFTADIIDTIGTRYREIVFFIPPGRETQEKYRSSIVNATNKRVQSRLLIRQFPKLLEDSLAEGITDPIDTFYSLEHEEALKALVSDTSSHEFGETSFYRISSKAIRDNIYIPKYYDPSIQDELKALSETCELVSVSDLVANGVLSLGTGDEIGKMAYGTGEIPFVRTSDFSNWELKHNVKQRVSKEIYDQYKNAEDVQVGDILLVRDGSYLIGSTCLLTQEDTKILYCGGLIKIRSNDQDYLDSNLLMGLLNAYIVKRQIRSKQFTRDVIDTIGTRLLEVVLPIPRDNDLKKKVSQEVMRIIQMRVEARDEIRRLSKEMVSL